MTATSINPTYNFAKTKSHQELQQLFKSFKEHYDQSCNSPASLTEARANKYCYDVLDCHIDFYRHWLNDEVIDKLLDLANESPLEKHIKALFSGGIVNPTENKPALHSALRADGNKSLGLENDAIHQQVRQSLAKMKQFCEDIHTQKYVGYNNSPITDIVHIGIGGSHLGPQFINEALQGFKKSPIQIHFWSAVDNYPAKTHPILQSLEPQSTLFILASKSFTTSELMVNARIAKNWFINHGGNEQSVDKHFIAVTANNEVAIEFGISAENIFSMWDWVGGRYSVWSAIGLPVMLSIGYENFIKLLTGAAQADEHFYHTPWEENIPVLMALIGIWYINYCQAGNHTVITYGSALERLTPYLQQLEMESNGKSVDNNGEKINYQTAPVIWGGSGIKGQHSYHQMLHQGTACCPIDFIGVAHEPSTEQENYYLLSNLLAQSYVLNKGKKSDNPHQCLDGNRPSTILLLKQITPEAIGKLLAFYEHKVFVQGVIWNINSFDQWGVEEGKVTAKKWQNLFTNNKESNQDLDQSTLHAVQFIQAAKIHNKE